MKHKIISFISAAGWPVAIGLLVCFVVIPRVFLSIAHPASTLTLEYQGTNSISDVKVIVTGREYNVGNLYPHTTVDLRVQPTNESHIEISFLTMGKETRLNAGSYIGPGACAKITVVFDEISIVSSHVSYF